MDPNVNLHEQLTLARRILAMAESESKLYRRNARECDDKAARLAAQEAMADDAQDLAERVVALNEWIEKGGFYPMAWRDARAKLEFDARLDRINARMERRR